MKRMLSMLVVPSLLLVPASFAVTTPWSLEAAAVQDDGVNEMARGNVTKIDASAKSFDIKTEAEGAKAVTITWNDATVFMRNGQVVKWDEIVKEKANLTVTHKKGLASLVEGNTKK
jgi:hypothetical protein